MEAAMRPEVKNSKIAAELMTAERGDITETADDWDTDYKMRPNGPVLLRGELAPLSGMLLSKPLSPTQKSLVS